jgi:hypothetical protein
LFLSGRYWDYYNKSFEWDENGLVPDFDLTRLTFEKLGIPSNEIESLIRSGYVMLEEHVVIDRYYGGALRSSDQYSRIPVHCFKEWYQKAKLGITDFPRNAKCMTANSLAELEQQISDLSERIRLPLVFRGQTKNHMLAREVPNPALSVPGIGEVSLIPSLWREMLKTKNLSFHNFVGLDLLGWSKIIYSQFDTDEIDRRVEKARSDGEWMYSAQDMEDSDDPVLHEFGRVRLDLSMGMGFNLADLLNTLLQHYGLLTPYLDLTTDLYTALFFATNTYEPGLKTSTYRYVGTNNGESVLYVLRRHQSEMNEYATNRVLHKLVPRRPEVQSCVICRSSPFAINLAADFVVAIIKLSFDIPEEKRIASRLLFPTSAQDNFLAAIKNEIQHPERIYTIDE